jgi:mRNA-degrading endonuclease YafQ of YafQ-DinJ toxin-antitoxin module
LVEVAFNSSFRRAFRKLIKGRPSLEEVFWARVEIFVEDPYDERLRTHKLSGKLSDLWSFSVSYDIRVVFSFIESDRAIFEDIGDHDTVY